MSVVKQQVTKRGLGPSLVPTAACQRSAASEVTSDGLGRWATAECAPSRLSWLTTEAVNVGLNCIDGLCSSCRIGYAQSHVISSDHD